MSAGKGCECEVCMFGLQMTFVGSQDPCQHATSDRTQQHHSLRDAQVLRRADRVPAKGVLAAAEGQVLMSSSCAQPLLSRSDRESMHQQQAMQRESHSLSESQQAPLMGPPTLKAEKLDAADVKRSPAEDTAGTSKAIHRRAMQTSTGTAAPAQPVRASRLAGAAAELAQSCKVTAGGSLSHGSMSSNPFSFEGSSSDDEDNVGSAVSRKKPTKEPTVAELKARCGTPIPRVPLQILHRACHTFLGVALGAHMPHPCGVLMLSAAS